MSDIGRWTQDWCEQSQRPSTYSESLTSTNELAKEIPVEGQHIISASHQVEGRGRGSHKWLDESGASLLSSWIYQIESPLQPVGSPKIGLAVFRALSASWPQVDFALKAPNDILIDGKKLAGLLIESVNEGSMYRLIIGLGLNVLKPVESQPHSTALSDHCDVQPMDWFCFLERLDLEFQLALQTHDDEFLREVDCEALKTALNKNSALSQKIDRVLPDGGLIAGDSQTSWRDL